ncbi:MAG TPA: flagellar hook-length control protein FliK [Sphingomonas sp.]
MSMKALALAATPGAVIDPAAAATPSAAARAGQKAKAFDAMMTGLGHPARDADKASAGDADTRVAARDDRDDNDDRKETKADRAQDAGEDPTALLALASSIAAVTRNDPPAGASRDKDAAATPAAATLPAQILSMPGAQAAPASAAPASAATAPADVAAMLPVAAQDMPSPAAAPKSVRPVLKTAIGATPSTTDILAARAAPVEAARGKAKDDADSDDDDDAATAAPSAPDPMPVATAAPSAATPAIADASPGGGAVLASGATDRQLDLAKSDAWLDGLARDIASTADSGGTLRFQLSPQALGNLHVELTRGDDGTAVKMTAATVDAQAILADARPRLIESARAHGVHISAATIDLGGAGTATTGGQHRDPSGEGASSSGQPPSYSASAGTGGDTSGQAQSHPRNAPDLYHGERRQAAIATDPATDTGRDIDAGYA